MFFFFEEFFLCMIKSPKQKVLSNVFGVVVVLLFFGVEKLWLLLYIGDIGLAKLIFSKDSLRKLFVLKLSFDVSIGVCC